MAGAKFQYDENGTTFHCFVLAFMALVVTPATCLFWPWSSSSSSSSSEEEEAPPSEKDSGRRRRCHCDACQHKVAYLKAKEPRQQVKQRVIKTVILIAWLALFTFAYFVYQENVEAQRSAAATAAAFDPYAILGLDAGASKAEAKKAYHRLSLLYHPDRPETGDPRLFMRLSKAYAALTDETARRNWEQYGNPDGPGATSFGIALPAWLVAEENSLVVLLVYVAVLLIGLPLVVRWWWANSSKYGGGQKVLLDTSQLFYFFIHRTPAGMNAARVLKVLSGAFEFSHEHNGEVAPTRESDNLTLPRLIRELVDKGATPAGSALTPAENLGGNRDAPLCYPYAIKARALLYAHLYRIGLPAVNSSSSSNSSSPSPLEADQKYLLSKCPLLLQEFVQCTAQLIGLAAVGRLPRAPALETLEAAIRLSAGLVQAVPTTGGSGQRNSPLLQLPHITDVADLRYFTPSRKRGGGGGGGRISGLAALAKMGAESAEGEAERRAMLRRLLTDRQYDDVVAFLGRLPQLTVEVRAEVLDDGEEGGRVTAGALVTATVTVSRRDMVAVFEEGSKAEDADVQKTAESAQKEEEEESEAEKKKKVVVVAKQPVWAAKKKTARKGGGGGRKNARGRQANVNRRQNNNTTTAPPKAEEAEEEEDEEEGNDSEGDGEKKTQLNGGGAAAGGDPRNSGKETEEEAEEADEKSDPWEEHYFEQQKSKTKELKKKKKPALFETPSRRSHPVHCPHFPAAKQEHWWVYVSDRGGGSGSSSASSAPRLVTVPFFMTNLVEREEVELKFSAPTKPGNYTYTVHVRSDSYLDLDYSAPLKLVVHAAPKPVTEHPQWADVSDSEEEDEEDSSTYDSDASSSSSSSSGDDDEEEEDYSNEDEDSADDEGGSSQEEKDGKKKKEESSEKSSTTTTTATTSSATTTTSSSSFTQERESGESFELTN